jgi:sterol O-acyltransferase
MVGLDGSSTPVMAEHAGDFVDTPTTSSPSMSHSEAEFEDSSDFAGKPQTKTTITTTTTTTTRSASKSNGLKRSILDDGDTSTDAVDQSSRSTTIQYSGAARIASDVDKDGVLTLRPISNRKDRKVKVKKVIQFTPRMSHFDRDHPTSQGDTFRGFYVLFWMLMALTMIRILYHSYLQSGEMVGTRFAKLISADAVALAISDAFLVGSTIICVPYVKVCS